MAEPVTTRRRQQTVPEEAGPCECMRAQDTSGVLREARSDSSTRNRRDPTRSPLSGQGAVDKPEAKRPRAGRESEGFVVPKTAAAKTPLEGRDPALVTHGVVVSARAWPKGPTTPDDKARELQRMLYATAKYRHSAIVPRRSNMTGRDGSVRRRAIPPLEVRMLHEKTIGQPCAGKPHARLERGSQASWASFQEA